MLRLSLATLLGLCAATVVAWRLGGTLGGGVLAGFTLGAGMSGLGAMYQRHALLHRPETVLIATGVSFLAKLMALLMGALAFRYIEAAAARADWRSFLVAFAAAVVIVLPMGVLDAAGVQRSRRRNTSAGDSTAGSPGSVASDGVRGLPGADSDHGAAPQANPESLSERLDPTEA